MIVTSGRRRHRAAWRAKPFREARDRHAPGLKIRTHPELVAPGLLLCRVLFHGPERQADRVLYLVTGLRLQ